MSEDLLHVRKLITDLYGLADIEPVSAHEWTDDHELYREKNAFFQYAQLNQLSRGMVGQDSGQPWFLYWILNGIEVCNQSDVQINEDIKSRCCKYLRRCHNDKDGGFSGSPGLQTHLASTYSAMMAIVNIGTKEAYDIVDIPKMKQYLLSIKNNLDLDFDQAHP
jgi:protein farnesyltransferase subunit beta